MCFPVFFLTLFATIESTETPRTRGEWLLNRNFNTIAVVALNHFTGLFVPSPVLLTTLNGTIVRLHTP
jgi:hypothetical protein